jgi:hypothetical protein
VRAELFNRRPACRCRRSGKRRRRGKCGGGSASGGGWESVHITTLATLEEQNRGQVGPTILFDRPRPGFPTPPSFISPWGGGARLPLPVKSACNAISPRFAHFEIAPGICRGWISGDGTTRKINARRFHNTASETTAQVLAIRLWRGCACRGKQGELELQISWWTSKASGRRNKPPREALRCLAESGTRRKAMASLTGC